MAIKPQQLPGIFDNVFQVRNSKEQIVFKWNEIFMGIKFNN